MSDGKTKIKVTIKALACELYNKCNPRLTDAFIHIHYFGGDSVNIVTSGLPDYKHELSVDVKELGAAMKLCKDISEKREMEKIKLHLIKYKLVDGEVKPMSYGTKQK